MFKNPVFSGHMVIYTLQGSDVRKSLEICPGILGTLAVCPFVLMFNA